MTAARAIAGIGLGVAALTVSTLVAVGAVGGPGPGAHTGDLLGPAPAAADELPAFDDCEQLRRWYVEQALPDVGPWGFGLPLSGVFTDRMIRRPSLSAVDPKALTDGSVTGDAVGSSSTGTNVQEAGVDEPDTVKTDGRLLARVQGRYVVVDDVSTDRPRELSRVRIPGGPLAGAELLLAGHTVLVLGGEPAYWGGPLLRSYPEVPPTQQLGRTHLVSIDLSDPVSPRVTDDVRVDGGLVSAREYGDGTVRAVLTNGFPPIDFVQPNRDRTPREARRENRRIVRETPIETWLPGIRTGDAPRHPLLGCADVRHPRRASGFGTISVLTFDAGSPASYQATAITAAGDLVYSSTDRLYVATADGRGTQVHAFAVGDHTTSYLTSGTVPGHVRDRWSLDEYDGHLRVATAVGDSWQPRENAVVVLDPSMHVVGRVDGLGRREQIQSVRWFDDLAVVVTFRQTDPLYTLDLSAPAHPRVLGALKIRGFSSYLHPVGGDRLLGVGQDATSRGDNLGVQVASFDLGDLRRVRRTGVLGFGRETDTSVGWDPRAFSYLPAQRVALLPVSHWGSGATRVVAVSVGADGSLQRLRAWPVHSWQGQTVRMLPLGGDRVALVDGGVRVLHVG